MEIKIIYDGSISPTSSNLSTSFKHGRFIYFDVPSLSNNQGINLGIAINFELPIIGGFKTKTLPLTLLNDEQSLTLDSELIYPLPQEVTESDYNCFLSFGSSVTVPDFRCYVITTQVTEENLTDDIALLKELIKFLIPLITGIPLPNTFPSLPPSDLLGQVSWDKHLKSLKA